MKKRRLLSGAAVLLWLAVIWAFSSQSGEVSMQTSGRIAEPLARFVMSHMMADADEAVRQGAMIACQFLLRKAAHFGEYLILGMLLHWFVSSFPLHWPVSFGTGVLCAAADEFHQFLIGSRTPLIGDVVWDSFGVLAGVAAAAVISCVVWAAGQKRKE